LDLPLPEAGAAWLTLVVVSLFFVAMNANPSLAALTSLLEIARAGRVRFRSPFHQTPAACTCSQA
jgi:hypothetical protein